MRVLVVNAGSSSLKVSAVDADDRTVFERDFKAEGGHYRDGELQSALREVDGI